MKRSFADLYGPWALVAGASRGVGFEFAAALALRGLNLVLVARNESALDAVASEIESMAGVKVVLVVADLADPDVAGRIGAAVEGLEIGLLVYNTGITNAGSFLELPVDGLIRQLAVNCGAQIGLVHLLAGKMAARGRGGLLFMSSLNALAGSPLVASYGGTKAFSLILGEGLATELRPLGIKVTVCCAGVIAGETDTEKSSKLTLFRPPAIAAARVASVALRALGRRTVVVPGLFYRIVAFSLVRLLPRALARWLMARTARELDFGTSS